MLEAPRRETCTLSGSLYKQIMQYSDLIASLYHLHKDNQVRCRFLDVAALISDPEKKSDFLLFVFNLDVQSTNG